MKSKTLLAVSIFVLAFQGLAFSGFYKWVDENGVTVFSDTPPAKNPEKAKAIEVAPVPSVGTPFVGGGSSSVGNKGGSTVNKVELYVTSWCPACKKALSFLRSQGIPFTAYDVEKDQNAARRLKQLDSRGVPLAIINGEKIIGFSERAYRQALDMK